MSEVRGIVEGTNVKPIDTKYGKKFKIGLKIEGNWYNALLPADDTAKYKGNLVSFSYSETNYGNSIDTKTLKVAESKGSAAHAGGPVTKSDYNVGIKVGHAINNAVVLAIAAQKPTAAAIEKYAAEIIKLSIRLEARYPEIVETAAVEAELAAEGEQSEPQQPVETPVVKVKPGRKAAAKPAEKPAEQGSPAASDSFDDDIPF